jgi:uncharacterized protein DUF2786
VALILRKLPNSIFKMGQFPQDQPEKHGVGDPARCALAGLSVPAAIMAVVADSRGRLAMGVNNRQRRAAKRRKREKQTGGRHGARPHTDGMWSDNVAVQISEIVTTVFREFRRNRAVVAYGAQQLTGGDGSAIQPWMSAPYVLRMLASCVASVIRDGWLPSDLAEISRRELSPDHVPLVAHLLTAEIDRRGRQHIAGAWLADLSSIGPAQSADLHTSDGMERALGLLGLFGGLPKIPTLIPPPGAARTIDDGTATATDSRVLSRVRSLLAKAESTEYTEEAEALSQKAQELISRYALERLIHRLDDEAPEDRVIARRFWIDPPYVFAKGMLVGVVADANRCGSVITEQLGFVTLFGAMSDLDAVELLATSLLVQASSAMLRQGRHQDWTGTSRTTSFRRSFMVSYAQRIGERLAEANDQARSETPRAGELVPLLQSQAKRIRDAVTAMYPGTVKRRTSITNRSGWAAGRAAADLASLDVRQQVTEAAS